MVRLRTAYLTSPATERAPVFSIAASWCAFTVLSPTPRRSVLAASD
jgi:hypothetical protein